MPLLYIYLYLRSGLVCSWKNLKEQHEGEFTFLYKEIMSLILKLHLCTYGQVLCVREGNPKCA